MADCRIEYPSCVNTLGRFNIFPELLTGMAFEVFQVARGLLGLPVDVHCETYQDKVGRAYQACTGNQVPEYFYVNTVFNLQSLVIVGILTIVWILSEGCLWSILAATLFVAFNLEEMTRVMWMPPLRESFGFPFWIMQLAVICALLKKKQRSLAWLACLCAFQIAFCASWQFANLALFVQTITLVGLYSVALLPSETLQWLVRAQSLAWIVCICLQCFNPFMLTSLYSASLLGAVCLAAMPPSFIGIDNVRQHMGPLGAAIARFATFILLLGVAKYCLDQFSTAADVRKKRGEKAEEGKYCVVGAGGFFWASRPRFFFPFLHYRLQH
eukprot:m.218962 g.218962  ORF g.218962 m.218962 type:complete len:327 (+) comp16995_c2_seq16:357-1337(+)